MSTESHAVDAATTADSTASDAETERPAADRPVDLLIVGTLGGGGINHYIDEQAERLPDHLSVTVYDMASDPTGSGVVWFVVSLLRSLWAALRFPFRRPPDVVHVHSSHRFSFYRAAFYVLYAKYAWRRPVIFHVHGSSFDDFVRTDNPAVRRIQSLVFGAVDRVVVLSEYWRDVLTPGVDDRKLVVLGNAVDPDEYEPTFGGTSPHVVFVSNLIARKGVSELIEAVDALSDRDVDFRVSVAGKGPLSGSVSALAARHDRVEYLGYVSEERKRELLDEGSVYVLPTYAEGLPIAMLEAMAGGNAVVSTDVGSIPEVIDGDGGVLVEPGDAAGLADALEALVSSPAEIEAMAERNRRLVEREYSWRRTTDRLTELYSEVADRGPAGR